MPNLVLDEISDISFLAKDLLKRMLNLDKTHRYNSMMALAHPFITRKFENSIPMCLQE